MSETTMLERIKKRLPNEEENGEMLQDLLTTVSDRLCLRLGEEALPALFESICVDASVKMYRRIYYEGISSEGVTNLSTSFVEDILAEYDDEIEAYLEDKANTSGSRRVVEFI